MKMSQEKHRAKNNRTLTLSENEKKFYAEQIVQELRQFSAKEILDKIICADLFSAMEFLPEKFVDLLIIDPPYNLTKNFGNVRFSKTTDSSYCEYLESWLPKILRVLKPTASVYVCCDWQSSADLYFVLKKYLRVRNRITWQREKGRGAKSNWKNSCEDIFFATAGDEYFFDVDAVKLKRAVLAPYRQNGMPKDWNESDGKKFRMTHPGNFWDDISIPFWSMPENTDHPTQKSEKLFAKLILASSPVDAVVFDPFLGSGTSAVVAKKLGRHFCGIEKNLEYCLWAQKRLDLAEHEKKIQGYEDGFFWERNSGK